MNTIPRGTNRGRMIEIRLTEAKGRLTAGGPAGGTDARAVDAQITRLRRRIEGKPQKRVVKAMSQSGMAFRSAVSIALSAPERIIAPTRSREAPKAGFA